MAIYYVKAASAGTGTGVSYDNAMSVTAHNAATFAAGDTIYLAGLIQAQIVPPSSGSAGNNIIYDTYPANPAILDGTTDVTSWTDAGGGIYTKGSITVCYFVTEDYALLDKASSDALSDGNWYYNSGTSTLYYKPTSGTPTEHIVGRASRAGGFVIGNKQYIAIRSLAFRNSLRGVYGSPSSGGSATDNLLVSGITVSGCRFGVVLLARNGIDQENNDVLDSVFDRCGEGILVGSYASGTEKHSGCEISGNVITHGGLAAGSQDWDTWYSDGDCEGIGIQNFNNCEVSHNIISGSNPHGGISSWVNTGSLANSNRVAFNYIYGLDGSGIIWGGDGTNTSTGNMIVYNIVKGCGAGGSGPYGGIKMNRSQSPSNVVANNVLDGNDVNLYLFSYANHFGLYNNISYIPVQYHIKTGVAIGSNLSDHNAFYPATGSLFNLKGTDYDFDGWKTNSGQDTGSINSDPLFRSAVDYHIKALSPCINAGVHIPSLETDFDGNKLPLNGSGFVPDIGAYDTYEYSQGSLIFRAIIPAGNTAAKISLISVDDAVESMLYIDNGYIKAFDGVNTASLDISALAAGEHVFTVRWDYSLGTMAVGMVGTSAVIWGSDATYRGFWETDLSEYIRCFYAGGNYPMYIKSIIMLSSRVLNDTELIYYTNN